MRTYTGTFTASGITYNYTIQAPDALVFMYSRHVFCKVQLTDQDDEPVKGREITCRISTTESSYDTRYTDQDGWVVFDIARTLQIRTANIESEMDFENITTNLAKSRAITMRIIAYNTTLEDIAVEAFNGANDTVDKFWNNGRRRLRWFRNYPFTFDFPNINGNWSVSTNGGAAASSAFPYVSTTLARAMARVNANLLWHGESVTKKTVSGANNMATDINGNLITNTTTLDLIPCATAFDLDKYCYLRWLGKHGELFYWLFRRHSVTDEVKEEKSVMSITDDKFNSFGILGNENRTNYTRQTSVVLHSLPVDRIDFNIIRSIVTSPVVDMLVTYDVQTTPRSGAVSDARQVASYFYEYTQWRRVKISGGSYTASLKGDKYEQDKQLVIKISVPEEGGLRL